MNRHKDHLTASCPYFQTRSDYKGGHWVLCCLGSKAFETAWERNQFYKTMCCERSDLCEIRTIGKVKRRGPKP